MLSQAQHWTTRHVDGKHSHIVFARPREPLNRNDYRQLVRIQLIVTQPASHAQNPLVSVYIPTKNRADLLERALSSVLAQTYPNIEILICDDNSSDDTAKRVAAWQKQHANILYIRSNEDIGACRARNKAIKAARGEFITGLDDDDAFRPDRLATFVQRFDDSCNFLFSQRLALDGKHSKPSLYLQPRVSLNRILRRNCIGSQIFVRRSDLIDNSIYFDPGFPAWQDYDFVTQLVLKLGPGTRVYRYSYRYYIDHRLGRITHPHRIRKAYRRYRRKYEHWMTPSQRCSLAVNASILTNRGVSAKLTRLCVRHGNLWDLMRIAKSAWATRRKGTT